MAGDNRHVTENFLRLNFSPKPGITPGTNDFILMDCDQITARYYVSIAGVSSTGKRLPSQNQLSDSITLPTVSTGSITAITATTATGSGTVSSDGGATVTARGIQWSIYSNFSVIAGSASGGSGTGSFTAPMTGLTPGTTYYVRAYATNSVGTAISYNMSFTTTAVPTASIAFISSTSSSATLQSAYNGNGTQMGVGGIIINTAAHGTPVYGSADRDWAAAGTSNQTGAVNPSPVTFGGMATGSSWIARAYVFDYLGNIYYSSTISFTI